ncbi:MULTISPECIES: PTS sugar transporter subunit IIB [unclassified Breznakia]|uniref:PTS sugar transporter subunit IIB n=1 Tax=unclassified Breznakia TaxID=2623764 RepID=UPI0024772ABC|nr:MULTISPECIES: PTS sugar transporter subunit IIB [unclassified Breznakia]MDH6368019.1 D-glucosaminate-specific PTS system IIB component [Breznakia sp. PH1-1]MDH6405095.1 D-glucosaminate-specific PTS system IIB component [Breznakia sp. PF1-11]MDH6412822.1 D-glucosaminate-specific PTS system IIB component [Breznakia sp. PFB1-11]MDH6415182.1 D-glucosaminate-specific PTS system IIB component [Breznakia sp. PFB1-14]MDH6417493.1 D-glucosaminate-specific PTS system IIB component [Breznakia sp. PFB1
MNTLIKLVRIDNRLLHSTVALNWNQFVSVNYTIVVDPTYNNDPFIESVMRLCLPKSISLKIFNVKQLMEFMEEESFSTRKIMVIFKDLATAEEAVKLGFKPKEIQLPSPASRIVIKKLSDYYNEEDLKRIQTIQNYGIKMYFQTAPLDTKEYNAFKRIQ